jgi:predicted P-loop ATPase
MTKEQILSQISQEEIIKKFLPAFNSKSNANYHSPFSENDINPSMNFYFEGQTLKFKSHNTGHQGDIFQFVADLHGLDCKNNFGEVLTIIAQKCNLNGFHAAVTSDDFRISFDKIGVRVIEYFKKFGITEATLSTFNVHQVKYLQFISKAGKLCKFDFQNINRVCICYTVNGHYKTYFPAIADLQTKSFGYKNQTTADIFGLSQIENKVEKLFIAAGEKDCLCLNSNGFTAISFQSENTLPNADQINQVNAMANSVFIVYDTDEPGRIATQKLANKTKWQTIQLPETIKDVADYFVENSSEAFQKLIPTLQSKSPVQTAAPAEFFTIFHQAENYLTDHYELRHNSIKLEIEISPKGSTNFKTLNENSLYVEMNKRGVKIGMDKLIAILKSSFVQPFNPLKFYFENLPKWDGLTDHIQQLCNYITCDEHAKFSVQFKKWMVRAVRCAIEDTYYNKQALILVHSKQNSGKTTFCRFLCPPALKEYLTENISDDKDSRIALAKNILINLDELSSLAKHEINCLKALFSKDIINERLPYDRKNTIIHRTASFIGSTNMAEFLTDETGSVRWLCFEISNINWAYSQKIDINQVWAQAFSLYKENVDAELTHKDIEENETRNAKFQQLSTEAEIIPKFLSPAGEGTFDAVFMTASEISAYVSGFTSLRLNKIMVGRAMPKCGFTRSKNSQSALYGYWCFKNSLF